MLKATLSLIAITVLFAVQTTVTLFKEYILSAHSNVAA